MNFTKIRKFCASKDTIKKVKRQPTEWEKILANHIYDKGLVPQKLLQLNNKMINNQFEKGAKDLNRKFSTEDTQMAS